MHVDLIHHSWNSCDLLSGNAISFTSKTSNASIVTSIIHSYRTTGMTAPAVTTSSLISPVMLNTLNILIGPCGEVLDDGGLSSVVFVFTSSNGKSPWIDVGVVKRSNVIGGAIKKETCQHFREAVLQSEVVICYGAWSY